LLTTLYFGEKKKTAAPLRRVVESVLDGSSTS
jgi:hypothetical protein